MKPAKKSSNKGIAGFLEKPLKVLAICSVCIGTALFFDGTPLRLYQMKKSKGLLELRLQEEHLRIAAIKEQLAQLKNPAYVEKQARERLEFLEKNDLLFVFSED